MKLLMTIADLSGGGTERVFSRLLQELPASKFDIEVCLWRDIRDYTIPDNLPVHVLDKWKPWHVFRTIGRLRHLIDRIQPDLLFSALYYTNIVTGQALAGTRCHPAWICRLANQPEREMKGLQRIWAQHSLARASSVICNSQGVSRAVEEYLGLAQERIRTIGNPIDCQRIEQLATEPLPFERPEDRFIIVHAGRLHRQKNQSLLLQSFAGFGNKKAELWILGKGPMEARLKAEAQNLGIAERIRWLGFQDNPFAFFRAADCVVLSSLWEGSPNVLSEAMACGTTVISTDCPHGPKELIGNNERGILVPPQQPEAMVKALDKIANNHDLQVQLGKTAQQYVKKMFDLPVIIQQYTELFEKYGKQDKHN